MVVAKQIHTFIVYAPILIKYARSSLRRTLLQKIKTSHTWVVLFLTFLLLFCFLEYCFKFVPTIAKMLNQIPNGNVYWVWLLQFACWPYGSVRLAYYFAFRLKLSRPVPPYSQPPLSASNCIVLFVWAAPKKKNKIHRKLRCVPMLGVDQRNW